MFLPLTERCSRGSAPLRNTLFQSTLPSQHCLYLLRLPQGQGSFLPIFSLCFFIICTRGWRRAGPWRSGRRYSQVRGAATAKASEHVRVLGDRTRVISKSDFEHAY